MPDYPDPQGGAYRPRSPRPPRRRVSIWTIIAPAGALALFIIFFIALSNSCLSSGCHKSSDDSKDSNAPANDLPAGALAKVRPGDSMGSIADRYNLKLDDLKACNPTIDPVAIQPGQRLKVSAATCEGKDLAAVGANPDPLAGETSASNNPTKQADGSTNGTAAADPSAGGKPAATSTTATTADGADGQ
jgi:LysM repeat protein